MKDLVSTISCAISTSTASGDGTYIDNDLLSTTATSSATYLSTYPANAAMIQAQNYVESMSIEQLVEFDQRLSEKEQDFIELPNQTIETSKVYIKSV